ncbi:MAG: hypothetical protein AB2L11_06620 [Syntrophobacteraceae bacterium]
MQDWSASASATLIGSMPHKDRNKAINFIIKQMHEIPVWPQLSNFPAEQMMIQYLEGLPGVSTKDNRVFVETNTPEFERELYDFYDDYLKVEAGAGDLNNSRFRMGEETGGTFFHFLDVLRQASGKSKALKGQIVGPFTLLVGLKDHSDRALLYDERMRDVVIKHLAMKATWQIGRLKSLGHPVILFLDEPALAGFGSSAFISVSAELIGQILKEVIDAVHEAGAMVGVHICANTDWNLLFDSAVDIINFDAFNFFDKFSLYRNQFAKFLKDGHIVAWGMVPTDDPTAIEQATAASLADIWLSNVRELVSMEIPLAKILSQSLFTPSCGCGGLSQFNAERVVSITRELSLIMQARI